MELEIGMYVRTKMGYIARCTYIDKELENICGFDSAIRRSFGDEYDFIYCDEQKEYIIKASHNIIDLIERFDLVNGHLVICKMYEDEKDIPTTIKCIGDYYFEEEDIKSIVTKEQFEAIKYEVKLEKESDK